MKRTIVVLAMSFLSFNSLAAAKKKKAAPKAAPVAAQGEAQARQLLEKYLEPGADAKALTEEMRPTPNDIAAVFDPSVAQKVQGYYSVMYSKEEVAPKADQTDLKLHKATTEELLAGAPSSNFFPLGWRNAAKSVKKGLVFYSWKFAKPGDDKDAPLYDGLVFVNGHWAWFPKIWAAVK